mmetsp:Transcript_21333/g.29629  ORF Transcript_21333/g.29629 Transcript_21333/m.29629 type:complete len:181 (-) Transcript_21333:1168-1710(-)
MSGEGGDNDRSKTGISTYSDALDTLSTARKLPSLVVFALDRTIWPFKLADCGDAPPGNPFPQLDGIVSALKYKNIKMAVVAQESSPEKTSAFLAHFGWEGIFTLLEVPGGVKLSEKLGDLRRSSGVVFEDMLYFDADRTNIREVNGLGASTMLVENGVTVAGLAQGLSKFEEADLDNRGY